MGLKQASWASSLASITLSFLGCNRRNGGIMTSQGDSPDDEINRCCCLYVCRKCPTGLTARARYADLPTSGSTWAGGLGGAGLQPASGELSKVSWSSSHFTLQPTFTQLWEGLWVLCVPHVATPCWPLGLSSRLWGKSPRSRWERWQGHHRSSKGGPCSDPLPYQPCAGTVQAAPRPQAVGSRGAEGYSRGDRRAQWARPPCHGQWGLPPGLRLLDTGCCQRTS